MSSPRQELAGGHGADGGVVRQVELQEDVSGPPERALGHGGDGVPHAHVRHVDGPEEVGRRGGVDSPQKGRR